MPDPFHADDHYYISGYSVADDPCVDANGVLLNKLGLTTTADLTKAEAGFVAIRDATLRDALSSSSHAFDLTGLQAIHHYLFQDIDPWAGTLRVVDIAKGDAFFLRSQDIVPEAKALFSKLTDENCLQGLDEPTFATRVGYYFGRINHIHPFREGNGRAQRAFIRLLAYQAGYVIDFSGFSGQAMIEACRQDRLHNDSTLLVRMIKVGLSRIENF